MTKLLLLRILTGLEGVRVYMSERCEAVSEGFVAAAPSSGSVFSNGVWGVDPRHRPVGGPDWRAHKRVTKLGLWGGAWLWATCELHIDG